MSRSVIFLLSILTLNIARAQNVTSRLQATFMAFESDPLFKHATTSLYVVDSKTGAAVFDRNSQTGMAPASSQKVITSVAAFELLGHDYRYKTTLGYQGKIESGTLSGNLVLSSNGDPTLGSWRWPATKEEKLLKEWASAISKLGIQTITRTILFESETWTSETVPDGWIWQDIGNYYGAGASGLNWRENQYDLFLRSGKTLGDTCVIVKTVPQLYKAYLKCEVTSAARGTGDNAFIYLPPYAELGFVRGTIPLGEAAFSISGSFPNPALQLKYTLQNALKQSKINIPVLTGWSSYPPYAAPPTSIHTHLSPPLDSINYWFLKKSINLYGEALIKTIGREKQGLGSTEKGLETVRNFWSRNGIEKGAIRVIDGSGLSPQNRVTTNALVTVMQYARKRPWYNSFYNSLPEINGIKMKSGSIGGARSYTGYIRSSNGKEYTFAFIVNNYDGSSGETVRKMWRVLDVLKKGG